jgi:hypothetical protein
MCSHDLETYVPIPNWEHTRLHSHDNGTLMFLHQNMTIQSKTLCAQLNVNVDED